MNKSSSAGTLGFAVDVEALGVLELPLVPFRGSVYEEDALPGLEMLAMDLRFLGDGATELRSARRELIGSTASTPSH